MRLRVDRHGGGGERANRQPPSPFFWKHKGAEFCHKFWFYNSYFFATQCCRPLIFQTINSGRSNNLSFKFPRFTMSGCFIFNFKPILTPPPPYTQNTQAWSDLNVLLSSNGLVGGFTMVSSVEEDELIDLVQLDKVVQVQVQGLYPVLLHTQQPLQRAMELGLCHKLKFSNPYIFATQCCRP